MLLRRQRVGEGGNKRFYRITQPEKTVYRIRDVDDAIAQRLQVLCVAKSVRWNWMRFSQIVTI